MALSYQCRGLVANVSQGQLATPSIAASDPTTLTAAQVFNLSSRPSAAKKIVLDFTGHTTTDGLWNIGFNIPAIVTPPYDRDGQPNSWSEDELGDIVAIWRAVAEDYSLFDIDVTTIDPGDAALVGNGVRACIGGRWEDWYGFAAGGVAYTPSFELANTPAFIFAASLFHNAQYVWEAVSHEVGHTFGLSHDGTATSDYYFGQGDWAPIMGAYPSAQGR